jgi:hypothetical protein
MSGLVLTVAKLFSVPAIVDSTVGKIFPGVAPQATSGRYIIVYRAGQTNPQLLGGDADMPKVRITTECYGASAAEADALGELVLASLKNVTNEEVLSADSPSERLGTITVMPADSDVDDYDDTKETYRRMIDFYVDWRA